MNSVSPDLQQAANWQYLSAAIAQVRQVILQETQTPPLSPPSSLHSFPLDQICTQFHLSNFERNILLACAALELDSNFAALCGEAQGDRQRGLTLHLLLTALPQAQWSAFTPDAPLRYWRLIELGTGTTLMQSPLRIDERILHYLLAEPATDERFQGILHPVTAQMPLVPSQQEVVQQVVRLWRKEESTAIQIYGSSEKQPVAAAAAAQMDRTLYRLPIRSLPTSPGDLSQLIRLWQREMRLNPAILLLDCEVGSHDPPQQNAIAQLLDELAAPLILTTSERRLTGKLISLELRPPTAAEQHYLWQTTLSDMDQDLNLNGQVDSQIERLVHQFTLDPSAIRSVCLEAAAQSPTPEHLWSLCRIQTRPQMDDLAQRIEATAGWQDLVLPEAQLQILRAVTAQVRQRIQVYQQWGFGDSKRGLGISALFAGASGTGKTMAAEVLAQELRLDLYRIDLSAMVSKYIGETEKNLRRVFDAAESGSVVLLFDEADALFGKRSEVKDSHDRYANMEVSYLLQRVEAYQGLAILTTNLKDAIDTAFLRRLRFVIKFPFPDAAQREEIWRRVFPANTPLAEIDVAKLARLNVAGGNIRNIAVNAAFLAADQGEKVGMRHLLEAAKAEYAKLERTLTDAEVRGWL
jgi:hypothetical protein